MPRFPCSLLTSVALLTLAACGGGGGGGGGGGPVPGVGTLAFVYPALEGMTDAATFTVRGTATSPDGITSLEVSGVAASTSDGFATWTAMVPLALGSNVLELTAITGIGGEIVGPTVNVTRVDVIPGQLSSIDWDPGTGTLWATEPQQWRVLEFSPSGNRVVGSIYLSGGGLFNKLGLSVDVAGDKAYAVQPNGTGSVLVQLDLSTSVVTTISSSSVGSGVAFQGLADGILDPVAQVYYALDRTAGSIVSVPVAEASVVAPSAPVRSQSSR